MPTATTLTQAAGLASDNLSIWFLLNNTQAITRLQVFNSQVGAIFPKSDPNTTSIQNWVSVLAATIAQIPATPDKSMVALDNTANIVYRMCWDTQQLRNNGTITAPQATAVLVSYNGNIAGP